MRRFDPVHLPDDRRLNGKASMTFLKHYARCPRSGYLYALYKGEASTPEMMRGSAIHAVHERAVKAMLESDEVTIPPELVKAIAEEVLADPEFAVPLEEHDYVRECAFRLGSELAIDPGSVVACETLFVLNIGGWQVRCRIDFAALAEDGAVCVVEDLKSSRALPAYDEIARKRADGSLATKSFQLVLYALVLAYGVPVRIEVCPDCNGDTGPIDGPLIEGCPCAGCIARGYVEVPEPFPVASRAQRFDLSYVYPGIEDRDGKMARRPMTLTRIELEEYRASLDGLLKRLARSEESGDWPAVASDEACAECPASSLCPIPVELRDFRGGLNTLEEMSEAAERLYVEKRLHVARQRQLREAAKAAGVSVPFGGDMEMRFVYGASEQITDKPGMWAAVERARLYGEPFDPGEFVKVKDRTDFKAVRLTADQIAERQEGSNGGDTEQGRDERWGSAAPF